MLEEILINKWFFSFIIGCIAFLFLIDWKQFHRNIWGGVYACALQIFQDINADIAGLYHINDTGIPLLKISVFFTFGIVFTMGVIFVQFLPRNPKLQLAHILFFSVGFVIFEYTLAYANLITHEHWIYAASLFDNILVMASFAWLKKFIYKF